MHALFLTAALCLGAKPAPVAATSSDDSFDTTIDGKAYRCSVTDMQGRYDTVCTPIETAPAARRPVVSAR